MQLVKAAGERPVDLRVSWEQPLEEECTLEWRAAPDEMSEAGAAPF